MDEVKRRGWMSGMLLARLPERRRPTAWRILVTLHCALITWVALTAPTPTPWYLRLAYTALAYFGWYCALGERPRPLSVTRRQSRREARR
jgi:hypothetical protein